MGGTGIGGSRKQYQESRRTGGCGEEQKEGESEGRKNE